MYANFGSPVSKSLDSQMIHALFMFDEGLILFSSWYFFSDPIPGGVQQRLCKLYSWNNYQLFITFPDTYKKICVAGRPDPNLRPDKELPHHSQTVHLDRNQGLQLLPLRINHHYHHHSSYHNHSLFSIWGCLHCHRRSMLHGHLPGRFSVPLDGVLVTAK